MNINDKNISRNINIGFSISLVLIVLVCFFSLFVIKKITENYMLVKHTHYVIDIINDLNSSINQSEATERAYIITRNQDYLEEFNQIKSDIKEEIKNIELLTLDNETQQLLISKIKPIIDKKFIISDNIFRSKIVNPRLVVDSIEYKFNKRILTLVMLIKKEEQELLSTREKDVAESARLAFIITIFVSIIALILIIASIYIINQYIKNKVNIELELRANEANLEYTVAVRTLELQRSNDELNKFAYVASHDLQEPLRTIASYTMLLERRAKDKLNASELEFMRTITDGASRMKSLIIALLEYSKVGTKSNNFKSVDLNDVLEVVKKNLEFSITQTNTKIINDKLPIILGEESLITQVFQNIIGNSIKYRNEDYTEIIISSKELDDKYEISVKDNGIGIEEKYFTRIFEVFQRLHSREKYEGTGIGLSTCKKIIELHNGKIWLDSIKDEGTTFYFTLPKIKV